jgi:hypothetical protein
MGVFATYVTRKIFADLEDLLISDTTIKSKELRELFNSDESYNRYRKRMVTLIYSKKELIPLILCILLAIGVNIATWPGVIAGVNVVREPLLLFTHLYGWGIFWLAVCVIGTLTYIAFASLIFIPKKLTEEKDVLSVTSHVKNLKNLFDGSMKPMDNEVTYYLFQKDVRVIGNLLFWICLRAIIVSILASFIYFIGIIFGNPFGAYLSLWVFFSLFFIFLFIFAQLSIHYTLVEAKKDTLQVLYGLYNNLKVKSFRILGTLREKRSSEELNLFENMEFFERQILQTEKMGTYSYDFPELFKLVAVAFTTVIPLILQIYLPLFGI